MDLKEGERNLFFPDQEKTASDAKPEEPGVHILHTVLTIGRGEKMNTPRRDTTKATTKVIPVGSSARPKATNNESTPQKTLPGGVSPGSKMERVPPPTVLGDIARVLRSKNAGPYEITLDAMFETEAMYQAVKQSHLLNEDRVAAVLGVSRDHIVWCGFFDPARAFKVTIPRIRGGKLVPAGGFMEDDVHGSQQHLELFNLELSDELVARLAV